MGQLNKELVQHVVCIPIGTRSADVVLPGLPVRETMRIKRVSLINRTALAADNTNFVTVQLQKVSDSAVLAEVDTRVANEGALVALTPKEAGEQNILVAAGESLKVNVDVSGTGALADAVLCLEMHRK